MIFARAQRATHSGGSVLACASLHGCDHEGGAGAVGGPQCQATHLAGPLDYGVNSAAIMLRGGSCQEHIAEKIGPVADKEGAQRHVP